MALSRGAFNRLVADHGTVLYRIAFRLLGDRHEAEDIVQETFRSAWKSRHFFRSGRTERAWLVAILRRRVADYWRRRPVAVVSTGVAPEVAQRGSDPHCEEYTDQMQRALKRLPHELREALLLVVVGELTHQEAADLLGVPLGTILSRVSRARKRLREQLLNLCERGLAEL